MTLYRTGIFCSMLMLLLFSCKDGKTTAPKETPATVFITPLGKEIFAATPSEETLKKYKKAKQDFLNDPDTIDNIIWYGRRTAYLGDYEAAIAIYSEGIEKFPEDARLYRHRGHRYISLRQFDKAIADLEQAVILIKGKENQVEPDGMPNAKNIPVSTLHGNIWYHLGLAYYLKRDMDKAYKAYRNCRNSGSNDDNTVSATHWLYMIQRRMYNEPMAVQMLEPIHDTMEIIENFSYYKLCQFYNGMLPADALQTDGGTPENDAIAYGLANWYFYNNSFDEAEALMKQILEGDSWNSFGYIAAENDFLQYFNTKK